MNKCLDCHKKITKGSKSGLCGSCSAIERFNNPKNHVRKEYFKIHYCSECDKQISRGTHTKCKSCSTIERFSILENCPGFGKHHSEKTKEKMRISHTGLHIGKLNGMWQGGISFLPYSSNWTEEFKESIRDRDNHECQNPDCNMTEQEHLKLWNRKLDIHHIDYNKENCLPENLISLCLKCHLRTQGNRDFWFAYFTELTKILLKCDDLT